MQDFINKVFGSWTVVSYEGKLETIRHWYKVVCVCGNSSVVERNILKRGKSTQCRCCARKKWSNENDNPMLTHGYSSPDHPEFHMHSTWCSIKQRCNNPKTNNYHRYGGRGIKVCQEWENSFETFLKDMGSRPKGFSIDRIDNNQGYSKDNCRWVTTEDNCNNTSLTVHYEHNGTRLSETQWSRKLGISRNKMMHWVRKNGIDWVIKNLEKIKKTKTGMSDSEYLTLGIELPDKRFRKD